MMLAALVDYYQRLAARDEVPVFGFSQEKISYALVLNPSGRLIDVLDIRNTTGKKPLPSILTVPQPDKRTVGIKASFLWDKTSYVLGVSAKGEARVAQEHEAFKALHREWLADSEDAGLQALARFLDQWSAEQFQAPMFAEEVRDANVVFRLEGEHGYLHQRPAAQALRARMLAGGDVQMGMCLIAGMQAPLARLHPAIKGVRDAQSSGASIVSFNKASFESYGKSQGDNAPISQHAAFAYTTVLNHLLRRDEHIRQCLQIGDTTVVFWAIAPDGQPAGAAQDLFAMMVNPPLEDGQEAARLRTVLHGVAQGRALRELDPQLDADTRFYVLGLAPNASRLSIRFWQANTLDFFVHRMAEHYMDLHIEPVPWRTEPALWRLLCGVAAQGKAENVPPQLAGEITRAILDGSRYPRSLLANVVMRMRADGDISGVRVALCKAVLAREARLFATPSKEQIPVSLDTENSDPAYRLGRLFATLEGIQRAALGQQINATIRDRYYGAASATPAAVFPLLLRNAQHHLARLRKDKPGLGHTLETGVGGIIAGLGTTFPKSLHIEDQGRFAIGYYHQSQARFAGKKATDDPSTSSDSNSEF